MEFVVLVCQKEETNIQEFTFPIKLECVEKWSGLQNIVFHQVDTEFQHLLQENKFLVSKLGKTNQQLENGKIYLVCGNEICPQVTFDIQDSDIANFQAITGCDKQTAYNYLDLYLNSQGISMQESLLTYFEQNLERGPADLKDILTAAIKHGKVGVIDGFYSSRVVDFLDFLENGLNLLAYAITQKQMASIEYLLQIPEGSVLIAQPSLKDGETPIFNAIKANSLDVVKILFERGSKLTDRNQHKLSLLHVASWHGYLDIVKYLIENRVDLEPIDDFGYTPLYYALSQHRNPTIEYLISCGCSKLGKDDASGSILQFAAHAGLSQLVSDIIMSDPDVNYTCEESQVKYEALPALHLACNEGHYECVKSILSCKDVDINKKTFILKQTPLHLATLGGHAKIVEILMDYGANCNLVDFLDRTAAHIALERGFDHIYTLLQENTKLWLRNISGLTAYSKYPPLYQIREIHINELQTNPELALKMSLKGLINDTGNHTMFEDVHWKGKSVRVTKYIVKSTLEARNAYKDIIKMMHMGEIMNLGPNQGPTPRIEGFCFFGPFLLLVQKPCTTLKDHFKETKANDPMGRLDTIIEISSVLHIMHSHDVVHKNLNIENFVIYKSGPKNLRGQMSIDEFGLSLAVGSNQSMNRFIAPEVAKDSSPTSESDVYSFGICIYELFFGMEKTSNHVQVPESTPDSLILLLGKCTEPEPKDRATMVEIFELLIEAKKELVQFITTQQVIRKFTRESERIKSLKLLLEHEWDVIEKYKEGTLRVHAVFCYPDPLKMILFDESESYIKKNWKDVIVGRIQKDALESLSYTLTDQDLDVLEKINVLAFQDPKKEEFFTNESIQLLETLSKLPEKKCFILFDVLRYLVLSPYVCCMLIHKSSLITKLLSIHWKHLETKPTKLMILRTLCNLLDDPEGLCVIEHKIGKVVEFLLYASLETEKSCKEHVIALTFNLTCKKFVFAKHTEWKAMLEVCKNLIESDSDLSLEAKDRILHIVYRLINGSQENTKYLTDVLDLILPWCEINMSLMNSINEIVEAYKK